MGEMTVAAAFRAATEHHIAGRIDDARALYGRILQVLPDDASVLGTLAMLEHNVGRSDVAIDLLARAAAANPAIPHTLLIMAEIHRSMGRPEAAAQALRAAAARESDPGQAQLRLGDAARLVKNWNGAAEAYQAAAAVGADLGSRTADLACQQVGESNTWFSRFVLSDSPAVRAYGPTREARRIAALGKLRRILGQRKIRILMVLYDTVIDALPEYFDPERFEIDVISRFFEDRMTLPPGRTYDILMSSHLYLGKPHALAGFRRLVGENPDMLTVGWLTDNHHAFSDMGFMAQLFDIVVPGHENNVEYLRAANDLVLNSAPLPCYQWTRGDVRRWYAAHQDLPRSDALYGGFMLYPGYPRNAVIEACKAQIQPNALMLRPHGLPEQDDPYFQKTPEGQFMDWMGYKVCLQAPIFNDVTARLFDALAAGQIPIAPAGLAAFDHLIPLEAQKSLPIIKFPVMSVECISEAYRTALRAFDAGGPAAAQRRHAYCVERHMFINTVGRIWRALEALVPDAGWGI
jgi:tetratricopeptide (TPR) repeat protein